MRGEKNTVVNCGEIAAVIFVSKFLDFALHIYRSTVAGRKETYSATFHELYFFIL